MWKKLLTRRQMMMTSLLGSMGMLLPWGSREARGQSLLASDGRREDGHPTRQSTTMRHPDAARSEFSHYSRFHPSFGGPSESDDYLGKLVPGFRPSGLSPVPITSPDLDKLSYKMVNGIKEFELHCMHVRREFLPDRWMNVWGFNGSMPGPTLEVVQGDRVRIIVHNDLPEPTTVHWHGLELPVHMDGVPHLTQDPIPPGGKFIYEFDIHQEGTFFYHSHIPLQEAFGMVGFLIIHPRIAYDPPVDRDFLLLYQNFFIPPNSATADAMHMGWNWHTINGRSGPYTTPLVVKHGERVRIRLLDFSPIQHHPIHLHGHTFWLTGTEGGRIPQSAWIPRNTTLTAVAKAQIFEFIAFNPGDWIFHCHMVHHMLNHVVPQVGPRLRGGFDFTRYMDALPNRPSVEPAFDDPAFNTPGYPEDLKDLEWTEVQLKKINFERETKGMREKWYGAPHGLMNVLRVLPDDLYERVMESNEDIEPGAIFQEIVRRKERYFRHG